MASNELKGYDCDFVDPVPDSLICLICTCVARDPQQTVCCGKIYCKGCLSGLKSSCVNGRCPLCRKRVESFPDMRGDRDIKSLKVHCRNKADGCEWTGELRALKEHLTGCDFTFVPCPNKCKDDSGQIVKLQCKELRKHKSKCPRRQYKCRHCKEAGEYLERTTTHLEKCPSMKVPCPNSDCRKRVARYELAIHRRDCPFEEVPCKYARIGCDCKFPRREREGHEKDTEQHLMMAIDTVNELTVKLNRQLSSVFTLKNFEQLKSRNKSVYSTPFYSSPGGYKMRLRVYANGLSEHNVIYSGTHISVFAYLMRGENDHNLQWPFSGRVIVELLNQLDDANHYVRYIHFSTEVEHSHRVVHDYNDTARVGYGLNGYCPHSALGYDVVRNCQYLKGDCLSFRVRAEACNPKPWLNATGDFLS